MFDINIQILSLIILIHIIQNAHTLIDFEKTKPTVQTKSGTVEGRWRTSFEGYKYASFEGIPYAKPPIGELRFQPPQPVDPWDGTWAATKFRECLQIPIEPEPKIKGSEDCLYINVFVPNWNGSTDLDVLVHIHGGGFTEGSGTSFVDPFFMMLRRWVFVTMNYRLGPLGFLSTQDDVVPGNNGLKDQVMALRWIQENIANFGGNPNSVTLTGFSAGGVSTHLHYLSPLSRNLYHRGFSISGSALNSWALTEEPAKLAKALGKVLACDDSDTVGMIDCLRGKSGEEIIEKTAETVNRFKIAPFGVVVEGDREGAFLVESPYELLKEGKVYDVPWICSHTTEEGLGFYWYFLIQHESSGNDLTASLKAALEIEGKVPKGKEDEVLDKIIQYYLPNGTKIGAANRGNYVELFSHRLNSVEIEQAIQMHASAVTSPVYHYQFFFRGINSIQKIFSKTTFKGACHGDDMVYLFGGLITKSLNSIETRLKMTMQKMLSNYVSTGVPKLGDVEWPQVDDNLNYLLVVGPDTFRLKTKSNSDVDNFWTSVGLLQDHRRDASKDEL